jgi:NAD(P)-dependent dehydrogenase (short-subunit alcohol dehydrogenase family)
MFLEGKKILITGAAREIGRTMALMMADEGADLGLIDRNPSVEETAEEIRKKGGQVEAGILDISKPDQVNEGVQ